MMKRYLALVTLMIFMIGIFSSQTFAANEAWQYQEDMPFSRVGAGVVELNGKVYFIGGYSDKALNNVEVYDSENKTWNSKKSMPTARSFFATEVVNGKIYVIGGTLGNPVTLASDYSDKVEIYDPASDSWTVGSSASIQRGVGASANLNGKIYYIGGLNKTSEGLGIVEEYNTITNKWSTKTSIPTPVHAAGAVMNNGKIYVFDGGYSSNTYNKVQVYDPATDTWSSKSSAPTSRDTVSAINYQDKIYVIGGYSAPALSTVEIYNPTNDTWETSASLNTGRWGFGSVVLNDSLYVFGGSTKTVEKISIVPEPTSTPTITPGATPTATPEPTPTVTPSPTPEQPTGDRAILVVTMNTGLEKEFDLSMDEVNAFIAWYENKQSGTGTASYAINKHDNNKGPFTSRKDYIIFDKILTFSVDEYSAK
ncbi:Kelch repeat-containing protein [Paenibacillus riograndensis]|nr:kelch repeat-containing protein [Paenibacillus riograndensis]